METEKIVIKAKRKGEEQILSLLGDLGFSRMEYEGKNIVVEKIEAEDIKGKPFLFYRIVFAPDEIVLEYAVPPKFNKKQRFLQVFPVFLTSLKLVERYYEINAIPVYNNVVEFLEDMQKMVGADMIEVHSKLTELQQKYDELKHKYEELVRSSEENARLLLECEKKRVSLGKRIEVLEGMSEELLKERIYKWLKAHDGEMDVEEFAKINGIAPERVEEGLEMLLKDGYIKRKL
ncbi:MAG: hypothetical protein ACPL06_01455 [Candidatus Anstonellales archaeon]